MENIESQHENKSANALILRPRTELVPVPLTPYQEQWRIADAINAYWKRKGKRGIHAVVVLRDEEWVVRSNIVNGMAPKKKEPDNVFIPTPQTQAIERRNFFERQWASPEMRAIGRRFYPRPNMPVEVRA
jgi:hypothetical protein